MDLRAIQPVRRPLRATLRAIPSKSVTHRALVAAALAHGSSTIENPLDADDTRRTLEALGGLGVVTHDRGDHWVVEGRAGSVPGGGELWLGESGTSLRLLLALAALGSEPSTLNGAERLRERPIRELVEALRGLGARVTGEDDQLPLRAGGTIPRGGSVRIPAGRSSQFASAMLLIGPRLSGGLELILQPPVVSLPYVELTGRVLADFGATVERPQPLHWIVRQGGLAGRLYRVEGDHSSASYFLLAAAIVGGRTRVEGLDPASLQPDRRVVEALKEAGCRVGAGSDWIEVEGTGRVAPFTSDLTDSPDIGPTLAVLAMFAEGPCTLRGAAHLRHKESDRLALLAENLRALGRDARAVEDRLEIDAPDQPPHGGRVVTASDHRIAMAFAVAGLRTAGVILDDAGCVSKSNPKFWQQFERLTR
jgi:3-phosphoshikimate 1-carboxyvinyltransferase